MKIVYVGLKSDGEMAFAHLTGIERWLPGDVHEVSAANARVLLQHPDVFAEAVEPEQTGPQTKPPVSVMTLAPGATVETVPQASIVVNGESIELGSLSKDELHTLAKSLDVTVHHASGPDKVISVLQTAFPAAA